MNNNIDNNFNNKNNRNKNKEQKLILGVLLGISVLCNVSTIVFNQSLTTELQEKVKEIENKSALIDEINKQKESLSESLNEKNNKIEELEKKVLDAEPWFKMSEEQQRKIDEENKRLEQERIAKEEAERIAQQKAEEEQKKKEEEERIAKEKADLEARTITLSNGNYTAGIDFDAGTYDIIAISGNGNVSSSNMFSGGLNAIMGVRNDGFYEKEYKNIRLPYGTELSIDGVKIKLVPKY